jgi:hypothetical protein
MEIKTFSIDKAVPAGAVYQVAGTSLFRDGSIDGFIKLNHSVDLWGKKGRQVKGFRFRDQIFLFLTM